MFRPENVLPNNQNISYKCIIKLKICVTSRNIVVLAVGEYNYMNLKSL